MMRYKEGTNIMVLNCGSSSLKYKVMQLPQEKVIFHGEAERVGTKTLGDSMVSFIDSSGNKKTKGCSLKNHAEAFELIMKKVSENFEKYGFKIDVFAHRYVHPGKYFSKTTLLNESNIKKLENTISMAPIHNPISLGLIRKCLKKYSNIKQYAVFDTAFHVSIPEENRTYALPNNLCKKYGIRKYGFHGMSHKYVMTEACRKLNRQENTQKIVSCHLGSGGSSVCAIRDARSVNNTMGFTPLEGLLMSTRAGDIDPALVFDMMHRCDIGVRKAEGVLNKECGILCVSERSSDLRDVPQDDNKNNLAFKLYGDRVKKYIAYYILILKGIDILIFTDTLGCLMGGLREYICESLEMFGINIDKNINSSHREGIQDVSNISSSVRVMVIPTDEELMIAREVYKEMER